MTTAVDERFDWLDELPLAAGPPDLRMGLHLLDRASWLPEDRFTADELDLKSQLLAEHDGLVELLPGHDDAVAELVGLMEIHLARRIERTGDSAIEALDAAARAVPDDFLLMARDETSWRLVGGSLVFPNRWSLRSKLGGTLAEVHGPVDGYDELLSDRADNFFDRLEPDRIVSRRNWFVHDDPTFFQPHPVPDCPISLPEEAAQLWIRSEWQTLRRLAFSGRIVFTVKTQVAPMTQVRARPVVAESMAVFLETASDRSLVNKDVFGRHDALVDYLRG